VCLLQKINEKSTESIRISGSVDVHLSSDQRYYRLADGFAQVLGLIVAIWRPDGDHVEKVDITVLDLEQIQPIISCNFTGAAVIHDAGCYILHGHTQLGMYQRRLRHTIFTDRTDTVILMLVSRFA
jgi:hypothetical protein